jgi:hypothetical protein
MTTTNRTKQQNADQKLVDGLTQHKSVITALPIQGKTLTPDQAIAVVEARIEASNAALNAKATAKAAVLAERTERAQTKSFVSSLRQVIRSMFGASVDVLADFGLVPPKAHKATPQKKVTAADKAKATRTLRHTMGKKQKAAIKATGPLPTETPAQPPVAGNTPAAPVTPVAPAAPGAPAAAAAPTPTPAAPAVGTPVTAHTQS